MKAGEIKKIGTLTIEGLGLGRIKISDSETGEEMIFSGQTWVNAMLEFKRLSLPTGGGNHAARRVDGKINGQGKNPHPCP